MRRPIKRNRFKGTYKDLKITFDIVNESLDFNQLQLSYNSPDGTLVIETRDDFGYKPNEIIVFNGDNLIIKTVEYMYSNSAKSIITNNTTRTVRLTLS